MDFKLKGKNIFIVEDNPLNRVVYQITIMQAGAVVEFDQWGRNAIHKLERNPKWDLIILDLMLSRTTSGFDVFKSIRANKQFDRIPIIAISASDPEEVIPKLKSLGFSGFISKPIDESRIVDQFLTIMNGAEVWDDGFIFR